MAALLFELPYRFDGQGDHSNQSRGGGHAQQEWGELSHCPSDNVLDHA
ncbi:hypothetical protein sync_1348 [Synechococcus sp. CC9311]|nr:hypothetical protein sync_1348 [Synechococcus sp. CC9311]